MVSNNLTVLLTSRKFLPILSLISEFDWMVGFYARLNNKLVCFVRNFSMTIAKSACLKCLIGCTVQSKKKAKIKLFFYILWDGVAKKNLAFALFSDFSQYCYTCANFFTSSSSILSM